MLLIHVSCPGCVTGEAKMPDRYGVQNGETWSLYHSNRASGEQRQALFF